MPSHLLGREVDVQGDGLPVRDGLQQAAKLLAIGLVDVVPQMFPIGTTKYAAPPSLTSITIASSSSSRKFPPM
jgi:hypothetical protein